MKAKGKRRCLYHTTNRHGNLVDSLLSATRDAAAAPQFFRNALAAAEEAPQQVTTDGHDSQPRAAREALGTDVQPLSNPYLNRRIEQGHRGIKQRYYPTLGLGVFPST